MENPFIEVALGNLAYDENYHKPENLTFNNSLVQEIISMEGVVREKLDLNLIQKNSFRGETKFVVNIPFKNQGEDEESYFLAYVKEVNKLDITLKVMTIKFNQVDKTTELSFENLDGSNKVTGVFDSDFQLEDFAQTQDVVTIQSLQSCLREHWDRLPWYIQAACGGSCTTCFGLNPISCAVCAGCLAGTGIRCI